MSWNVQNLFDAKEDGTEYYEYSPAGGWDTDDSRARLASVAEVIRLAVPGGADILLLLEVENGDVAEELAGSFLRGLSYPYRACTSGEGSAVQVAVLSRVPILSVRSHAFGLPGSAGQRPVLEAEFGFPDGERLVLFGCHWKSKSGGAEETEPRRIEAARLVRGRIASLAAEGIPFCVAGDLNEHWDEALRIGGSWPTALVPADSWEPGMAGLPVTSERELTGSAGEGLPLYTPWEEEGAGPGSYRYRDLWERIDHVLPGPGLFDGKGVEYAGFGTAAAPPWCDENGYPAAFNMGSGTGYSDHLPLLMRLRIE